MTTEKRTDLELGIAIAATDVTDGHKGLDAQFFYHSKARSGKIENVTDNVITLELDEPGDGPKYKSFSKDKIELGVFLFT